MDEKGRENVYAVLYDIYPFRLPATSLCKSLCRPMLSMLFSVNRSLSNQNKQQPIHRRHLGLRTETFGISLAAPDPGDA